MGGKSSRDKGKRHELEVAKIEMRKLGGTVRRTPNSGGLDIKGDLTASGNALEGMHQECKRWEAASVWEWIEQAQTQARHRVWLVIFRRSREPNRVLMDLDDLLNILAELQELRAGSE